MFGIVELIVEKPIGLIKLKSMFAKMSGNNGPLGAELSCGGNGGCGNDTFTISPGSNLVLSSPFAPRPGRNGILVGGTLFATLLATVDPVGVMLAIISAISGILGIVIGKLMLGIIP